MDRFRRPSRPQPPSGYLPPWRLTPAELAAWRPPTGGGDSSRGAARLLPAGRAEGEWSSLADCDPASLAEYLGAALLHPAHRSLGLADRVRAGERLTVYRATDAEDVIWPGAYVTLARAYALDHGGRQLAGRGRPWWVLRGEAFPDELAQVGAQEFWFVPRDLGAWHRAQVEAALRAGQPVPEAVLAHFPGLTRRAPRGALGRFLRGQGGVP